MISGTLSKGQLFWPRMYLFSLVRDSFMCMKPWLLLETEEDRKSSKQNSDLYKTKPDYFYHALTQKIFEKKLFVLSPLPIFQEQRGLSLLQALSFHPKRNLMTVHSADVKTFHSKPSKTVEPICKCSKYCSWEISVWIKATY